MTASQGRGGVEHCLSSNFRVLGLQVIKTGKDFLVGANGATGLVATGPLGNRCFPFVPVLSAFPRHLFATTERNGGGVEHCLSSNFRVLGLQVIKTGKDFPVGANGATGLIGAGPTVRGGFPFVSVIRAFPGHLLAATECNGRGIKHCFGSNFRVGFRQGWSFRHCSRTPSSLKELVLQFYSTVRSHEFPPRRDSVLAHAALLERKPSSSTLMHVTFPYLALEDRAVHRQPSRGTRQI